MEVGNQIILTQGGYITNFSFEYWAVGGAYGGAAFNGNFVQARVRWYLNDGPTITQGDMTTSSPGTLLKDTGWIDMPAPTTGSTLTFSTATGDLPLGSHGALDGLYVPSRQLTWTVQFRGMGAGDELGLELFGPPTIGGMYYTDYWTRDLSGWQVMVNTNGIPMTFGQEWMAWVVRNT